MCVLWLIEVFSYWYIDVFLSYVLPVAVENILRPIVHQTNSYIQDTTDFLNKIKSLDNLPDNTLLVTMDVVSYPNIPHKDGLDALTNILNEQNKDVILTHNYLTFKDKDTFYV